MYFLKFLLCRIHWNYDTKNICQAQSQQENVQDDEIGEESGDICFKFFFLFNNSPSIKILFREKSITLETSEKIRYEKLDRREYYQREKNKKSEDKVKLTEILWEKILGGFSKIEIKWRFS